MRKGLIEALRAGALTLSIGVATQAFAEPQTQVSLFKVITVKDEVFIGLNAQELQALGGPEKNAAGAIASALADKKEMTVWQYSVRKSASGESQMMPLHQIGLLANNSLRVEPYSSPFAVLPHE